MPAYVSIINTTLALGTVLVQFFTLVIVSGIVFYKPGSKSISNFFRRYTIHISLSVVIASVLLSLFYSDIVGFPACELCIIQRFFIYPQVLILGFALWKHEKKLLDYSGILAIIGAFVSMYHVYVENGGSSSLACVNDSVTSVSCSARYIYEFGYITIPSMALTVQLFILILIINYRFVSRKSS